MSPSSPPPTSPRPRRGRRLRLAGAGVAAAVALLAALPAAAQEAPAPDAPPTDPAAAADEAARQQLEQQVTTTQQALDSHAKVLRAEAGVVRAEVLRLREAIAAKQVEATEAKARADAAVEALAAARAARAKAVRELAAQRIRTKEMAADAFISGPAKLNLILDSDDINDAVRRQSMAAAAGEATARTLGALDRAKRAAVRAEAEATVAAEDAAAAATTAEAEAAALADQQSRQTLLLTAVNDRLAHTMSEAASLAAIDVSAADAFAERDAILKEIASPAFSRPLLGLGTAVPAVATTRVGTITVSVALAPSLQALLDHAARDGFSFGGGGFRDPQSQIALRVLHCGPTDYDVWERPAGECNPPTARPGTSMHEQGLAIDFTVNGKAIVSERDPAYLWLAANAAAYGLFNLPGEPWHWSTTGG